MSEKKNKSRIQVADSWEAYTVECPECWLVAEICRGWMEMLDAAAGQERDE